MTPIIYYKGAENPSTRIWWEDDDGTLVDLSAVSTWQLKIGNPGETALVTKTNGMTGAAGAGVEPSGTPNLVIVWSSGDLDIDPGHYVLQVKAGPSTSDRVLVAPFWVNATVL